MIAISRSDPAFPKCLLPIKEVKGVSIDYSCINRPSKFRPEGARAIAHAHHFLNDKHRGWICLRWKYLLNEPNVLLHEAAHILINFHPFVAGHGEEWQEKLREIGGTTKPFLIGRSRLDKSRGTSFQRSVPGFRKDGRIYRMSLDKSQRPSGRAEQ